MDRPPHLWSLAIWNSIQSLLHDSGCMYGCMGCLNASALGISHGPFQIILVFMGVYHWGRPLNS